MVGINNTFKLISIAALLLLFSVGTAQPCETFCRFRLCFRLGNTVLPLNQNPITLLRPGRAPQGPFPCQILRNGNIRELRNVMAGEASVAPPRSSPFVPISDFTPASPRFRADYFAFGFLAVTERDSIVRRNSRGNQNDVIENLCTRLPITSHDLLRRNGSLRRRVFLSRRRDCVGFRTRVAQLDIEFLWDTMNDFNLRLEEPDRTEINRANPMSPNTGGRLNGDSGGVGCIRFFPTERIRYLRTDTVPDGRYTIMVDNVNQCSPDSDYTLRVTFNGEEVIDERGTISTQGENVLVRSFDLP